MGRVKTPRGSLWRIVLACIVVYLLWRNKGQESAPALPTVGPLLRLHVETEFEQDRTRNPVNATRALRHGEYFGVLCARCMSEYLTSFQTTILSWIRAGRAPRQPTNPRASLSIATLAARASHAHFPTKSCSSGLPCIVLCGSIHIASKGAVE